MGVVLGIAAGASAFSLLGPFKNAASGLTDPWQSAPYAGRPQGLGYTLAFDIGGPMFPLEAYRWNIPVITYAYDYSFLRYFGTNGVNAVDEAIAILNALPAASAMSPSLSEFPLDSKGENSTVSALGLFDLKSQALAVLLEEMGLARPARFVWGLRSRATGTLFTNYAVIQLNFDPITIEPTRFVNGVLYNYRIFDALGPMGAEWASAVEWYRLDPLYPPFSAVAASGVANPDAELGSTPDITSAIPTGLTTGQYYHGLTRDDVGGLRYLLSTNNMAFEALLPTVFSRTAGNSSSPWSPILSTNLLLGTNLTGLSNVVTILGTNATNLVRIALRPGVDKITFQKVGLLGTNFSPMILRYTDQFINPTNGRPTRQPVERLVLQPDIIFAVGDLGVALQLDPNIIRRTSTASWTNNAAMNSIVGVSDLAGPGTINPPMVISFSDLLPYLLNFAADETETNAFGPFLWGSFDGSDRPPVVYPAFPDPRAPQLSLDYLRDVVLRRNRR